MLRRPMCIYLGALWRISRLGRAGGSGGSAQELSKGLQHVQTLQPGPGLHFSQGVVRCCNNRLSKPLPASVVCALLKVARS